MPSEASFLQEPAQAYMRGLQIGSQLSMERARLSSENARAANEAKVRQDSLAQEHAVQQQRIQVESAYHQQQVALRQRQLEQATAVNAAKTREAALKTADQMGLAKHVAGGGSIAEGLFKYPRANATPYIAMDKESDIKQGRQDRATETKRHNQAMEAKSPAPRSAGTINHIPIGDSGTYADLPYDSPAVNANMGTNAPPLSGTNYPGRNAPVPVPAGAAAPAAPQAAAPGGFKEGQMIRNKKTGQQYIVKGGVPVPVQSPDSGKEP